METKIGRLIEDDDYYSEEKQRIEMEMETKRGRLIEEDDDYYYSEFFLPPEINTEILSRLPGDSAIGCRIICKPWRYLIDHPSFLDTHTRQLISTSTSSNPKRFGNYLIPNSSSTSSSSGLFLCAHQYNMKFRLRFIEYNDDGDKLVSELNKSSKLITRHPFPFYLENWGTLLISSCNGLVFMGSTIPNHINDMFVCNPFTREYVNLRTKSNTNTNTNTKEEEEEEERQRRQLVERKEGRMSYGFGYLPSTNEYKVVSIYYENLNGAKGEVRVYTLGSGRWRNKGEIPYWLYNAFHPGFFANGAIHWLNYAEKKKIVTFDLADEEFRMVVPSPPPVAPSANHVSKLGVLGGCLCVTRSDKRRCENPKHIWVLNVVHTKEEEEGKKDKFSWNKRFIIPWKGTTSEAEPCVILKSGKVLLLGGTGLISYDPKTGAFNEGDGSISLNPRLKVIPYAKSFVSLKALGEEDAKCFGKFVFHALAQQQHWQQQG